MGKSPDFGRSVAERAAAFKREGRIEGVKHAGWLLLSIAGAVAATMLTGSDLMSVLGALWSAVAGFLILGSVICAWDPSIPGTATVFDRPINTSSIADFDDDAIYLYWDELKALAKKEGFKGLHRFEGRIRSRAARHDPARGIEAIDDLLRFREHIPPGGELRKALKGVRSKLKVAEREGAKFCLILTTSWSGAIETNLKLYFR